MNHSCMAGLWVWSASRSLAVALLSTRNVQHDASGFGPKVGGIFMDGARCFRLGFAYL